MQPVPLLLPWRLHYVPLCASTERDLSRCLQQGTEPPLAVVARRQRYGVGQHGRQWQSPAGGLWLSAAIPWQRPLSPAAAEQLPRRMAAALAAELAPWTAEASPPLTIKSPNDLMVGQRKLAGVLSSVTWRGGQPRLLRFGIGLNGRHPIAPPGITLEQWLNGRCPRFDQLLLIGLGAIERLAREAGNWDTELCL